MYINSLPNAIRNAHTLLYADDTAIVTQGNDPDKIADTLSAELSHANTWLKEHKLSLNTQKTKSMYFDTAQKLSQSNVTNVRLYGIEIENVTSYKYLSLVLDQRLRFDARVDHLVKKLTPKLSTLRCIRKYLTIPASLYLYCSLIEPCFTFNDFIYDPMTEHDQQRLQVLQNNCL